MAVNGRISRPATSGSILIRSSAILVRRAEVLFEDRDVSMHVVARVYTETRRPRVMKTAPMTAAVRTPVKDPRPNSW